MLTVTGDAPSVSAVVAVNFAAIAAQEARGTLLIDTNGSAPTISAALRLPAGPGLAELASEEVSWPEAVQATQIGRDRMIDVVPSGKGMPALDDIKALLRRDTSRLSRRYDAIVLVSSPDQVSLGLPTALPIPDVIYCARAGQTPIAELKKSIEEIALAGGTVRGIVLWDAPDPILYEVKPAEPAKREAAAV
jgi:Mrp family chromosome partitioning ATPase